MKRVILLFFMVAALTASAQTDSTQTFSFGYLSYEAALKSMPEFATVQQQMADLRSQYLAETKRVEDEFNRKYEEFLEGQRDFPRTILQKRQTELQELMEKNILFKEKSREASPVYPAWHHDSRIGRNLAVAHHPEEPGRTWFHRRTAPAARSFRNACDRQS